MLRPYLYAGRQTENFLSLKSICRYNIGHSGLSLGNGPGLVEDHRVNILKGLNSGTFPDKDTILSSHSASYHQGSGSSQSQCTGTGNN
ncbi:hypothetical protein ES703_53073 [subsurface metagenome]